MRTNFVEGFPSQLLTCPMKLGQPLWAC